MLISRLQSNDKPRDSSYKQAKNYKKKKKTNFTSGSHVPGASCVRCLSRSTRADRDFSLWQRFLRADQTSPIRWGRALWHLSCAESGPNSRRTRTRAHGPCAELRSDKETCSERTAFVDCCLRWKERSFAQRHENEPAPEPPLAEHRTLPRMQTNDENKPSFSSQRIYLVGLSFIKVTSLRRWFS